MNAIATKPLHRSAPGLALTCALVVALAIASTTTIFSVIHGVLLEPPPFVEPDRLVALWTRLPGSTNRLQANAADHRDWLGANQVFEDIALAGGIQNFNLTGTGDPERLFAARMSSSIFSVLGVAPALGRTFSDADASIGRDRVVLLSDRLWRRRFGADPSVVGRTINLSGQPFEVVGVMRPDFQFPGREHELWIPLTINPAVLSRQLRTYDHLAIARLRPGIDIDRAQAEMDTIARRLALAFPASNLDVGVDVLPLLEESVRAVRPALYLIVAAVSCLLLVACLNLANLLGTRSSSRAREFAVRLALGASRKQLAAQVLVEVAPVLAIGAIAGIAAARGAIAMFLPVAPAALPRVENIEVNRTVLAVSMTALLLAALSASMVPAIYAWRGNIAALTRGSRASTGSRHRALLRSVLVVAQLALTLPLLVGATALVRSFAALMEVDPGFRTGNVLTMHLAVSRNTYTNDEQVAAFCRRIVERVTAIPGIVSAAMVNRLPLAGTSLAMAFEFERFPGERRPVQTRTATPGYFLTMGIPLHEGRDFTSRDTAAAPLVAIVDQGLARSLWPGTSAIGKRFRVALPGSQPAWGEIIGVAGNVRHVGLEKDNDRQLYFHHAQFADGRMVLVVRGRSDARALTPSVVRAIREVDRDQPVYDVRTMDDVVGRSTGERWLNTVIVGAFAVSALLLAGAGLFGVIAFGVSERMREFGVRLALGATATDVSWLVLRNGSVLAAYGTALGLGGAVALVLAMQTLLYSVTPLDPVGFLAAAALLFVTALVASYVPARRAALADPVETLRAE
jgi:putative ABC transport system permease protein